MDAGGRNILSRRVAMLVSNACAPDRRVLREAQALTERGYQVWVIAWDREGRYPARETLGTVEIERVAVKSAYGTGLRRLGQWPAYARYALARLRQEDWHAVHCHDLDTLPIGFAYTRFRSIPLVFDAHESYPDLVAPQVPGWAAAIVRWIEQCLVRRVDALITVGDLLAEHYLHWAARVVVVRNCQPTGPVLVAPNTLRTEWHLDDVELILCYVGGFTRGRVILPLIEAVVADPSLGLVLVGDGPQAQVLMDAIGDLSRIAYLGPRVPPDQVVNVMRAADVVYYGLRPDFPNNHYSSPNALYSALEAGRPLLTTDVGEISHIVREEDCGLVLPEPTVEAIALALLELRDTETWSAMAQSAERAAKTKYNWNRSEAELLALYQGLWGDV